MTGLLHAHGLDQPVASMGMDVDETGHNDLAGCIDGFKRGVASSDFFSVAHRDYPVAGDRHGTPVDDPTGRVHRDYCTAGNNQINLDHNCDSRRPKAGRAVTSSTPSERIRQLGRDPDSPVTRRGL